MATYIQDGTVLQSSIRVSLPPHVWDEIERQRHVQAGEFRQPGVATVGNRFAKVSTVGALRTFNNPPMRVSAWFCRLIEDHHADPIEWPDFEWLRACGEGAVLAPGRRYESLAGYVGPRMVSRNVSIIPRVCSLLEARAKQEGKPMAEVLRRLARQVIGV